RTSTRSTGPSTAAVAPPERATLQPPGAWNEKPGPRTVCASIFPAPPQPARMQAATSDAGLPRTWRGSNLRRERKDRRDMKTKRKVYDAAEGINPYVDRAMNDERLRDDLMRAYGTAKDLYRELMGETKSEPVRLATRVATDEDVRERLRQTIEDLR